jgi:uncharacterized protein involved in response to NO
MTRATLGHTGRTLHANAVTVGLYISVAVGALLRVAASLGLGPYMLMLDVAGIAWALSLAMFLLTYGPMLWTERLEQERPLRAP